MIFRGLPQVTYYIGLGLMMIGGWLSSSDQPLFRKKKES